MRQMISPEEARRIALEHAQVLPLETVAHDLALRRVLARDVISELEIPPFDNSAMDGYAVIAEDLKNTSRENPVALRLLETIGAGEIATQKVESGTCLKIMTGAKIPDGANAVVMREEIEERDGKVLFFDTVKPNQNIRPRGDDVKRGEKVLPSGTRVRPAEWAMLASLGCANVEVFGQPRVGIITTGEELVDVGVMLQGGQIHDSNSFALEGLCREIGASIQHLRVGDDVRELKKMLREYSLCSDCIITSGGVSAGDFDPVRDALLEMESEGEATIHFWKIAIKPGKPVMFAMLKNGIPVFGLPGNPVSVMVSFEQFVRPALLKMGGQQNINRVEIEVEVLSGFRSPQGKTEFVRAQVFLDGKVWKADATGDQSSGRLSTMTCANALLIIPSEKTQVQGGEILRAQMTDWPEM